MPKRYTLIVVHRGGSESQADFGKICAKVQQLDSEIAAYPVPISAKAPVPDTEWRRPTLVVALQQNFQLQMRRGTLVRNHRIEKLAQAQMLRNAGLPTPPAAAFSFGMKLDPILFGEFVLIKPMDYLLTSKGLGVQVMRRTRLEKLLPSDMPEDHPIHRDREGYIVQKLVDTGRFPTTYRVATFMGELLYGLKYESLTPSPELSSPDNVIEAGEFTQKGERSMAIFDDEELFALAKKVAGAFDKVPLLGIDFVRDHKSLQPYILEVNPGGNTWHFSSKMWAQRRRESPELIRRMKRQFSAYDAVARALVEKTHQLAS